MPARVVRDLVYDSQPKTCAIGRFVLLLFLAVELCCERRGGVSASSVKRHVRVVRDSRGGIVEPWQGKTVRELHNEYGNIFKYGNRNAASHLWSSFLIDRAPFMPDKRFRQLSGGYCAVSGSPVGPADPTRYRLNLEKVDGTGKQAGFMYYCCWPCVCDTQDFIKVDTKTVATADGPKQYNFAVIGNPCDNPSALSKQFVQPFDRRSTTIEQEAREVRCKGGRLEGATMSDNNYVIISMFFDASKRSSGFQDESDFEFMCEDRKNNGYNSGMGEIFRRVAAISPIDTRKLLAPPSGMNVKQLRSEAFRRGLDTRGITEKRELVKLMEGSQVAHLQTLGAKQLRLEAHRLGVDVRGVADKSEMVELIQLKLGIPVLVRPVEEISDEVMPDEASPLEENTTADCVPVYDHDGLETSCLAPNIF